MKNTMDFLKGSARVELRCKYSERAVNICARNHVDFWDLTRLPDGAAEMTVSIPGYVTLRRVAERTGAFTVRIIRRRGVPFFLWRIRKRYALLIGMAACLFLVGLSSLYIWQIDVTGNENIPTSEILAALKDQGVDIGTNILTVSARRVANDMLIAVPELSFITLNTHGSRLEVIVRERVEKPELYDPDVPTEVIAGKSGIIREITVHEGWQVAGLGDTVVEGDRLVSSFVPIGDGRVTHAKAEFWARTWYEIALETPLQTMKKEYTGEKTSRTALILGGNRVNLYFSGGNPYTECDKMTVYTPVTLPGGAVLPVTVVRDSFEEFKSVPYTMTVEEAERLLTSRLLYELEELIGEGYIVSHEFETKEENGLVTVTLRAECVEQIAVERALTQEEIDLLKTPAQ